VLSPVSAAGKVTSLVPELDGGIFTRFDLSFDAKKVVFGYKRKTEYSASTKLISTRLKGR
jgi:hypothetical protein